MVETNVSSFHFACCGHFRTQCKRCPRMGTIALSCHEKSLQLKPATMPDANPIA